MKTTFAVAAALTAASLLSLTSTAQAAPTRAELEETQYAQALKEAGSTFPAIEEALKARRTALAEAAGKESAKSASAREAKSGVKD